MKLYQEAPSLRVRKVKEYEAGQTVFCRETMQHLKTKKIRRKIIWDKIETGETSRAYVLNLATGLASYLKHKERGKKDGRAIASANMIMRMFLHITEDFHLNLSNRTTGPTMSRGGEDKKRCIIVASNSAYLATQSDARISIGTEDVTKLNECVQPPSFGVKHETMFNAAIRKEYRLPPPSESEILLRERY